MGDYEDINELISGVISFDNGKKYKVLNGKRMVNAMVHGTFLGVKICI